MGEFWTGGEPAPERKDRGTGGIKWDHIDPEYLWAGFVFCLSEKIYPLVHKKTTEAAHASKFKIKDNTRQI